MDESFLRRVVEDTYSELVVLAGHSLSFDEQIIAGTSGLSYESACHLYDFPRAQRWASLGINSSQPESPVKIDIALIDLEDQESGLFPGSCMPDNKQRLATNLRVYDPRRSILSVLADERLILLGEEADRRSLDATRLARTIYDQAEKIGFGFAALRERRVSSPSSP